MGRGPPPQTLLSRRPKMGFAHCGEARSTPALPLWLLLTVLTTLRPCDPAEGPGSCQGPEGIRRGPAWGNKAERAKQRELRAQRASWRKGSPVSLPFASSPLSRVLGPWAGRPAQGLSASSLPCASVCLSPSLWVWHVSFPCSSPPSLASSPSPSPSPMSDRAARWG